MTEQKYSPIKVLLVDDDEDDTLIIKKMFSNTGTDMYVFDSMSTYEEALEAINTNQYDIYLVDYRLGRHSGLDLLKEVSASNRKEPFIILTGANSKTVENRAMKMGVADYLVKGKFDIELLSRVIRYSLQRKTMEAQRIQELIDMNKSKDEFISLASHQLRTPATAVKQYVGMILQGFTGDVTEQQREYLESAYNSNERQLKIVNAILGIARLDLKKIRLNLSEVDIRETIDDVIDDVKPEADERKQRIIFERPSRPVLIEIDKIYLSMAINNILDNAVKYSPNKTDIEISIESTSSCLKVNIKDHGVGIHKHDQKKLFKKFSRIDNPLSVAANGTGVGLYWSHEVVKMHNGRILVDSLYGKSTTFSIELPLIARTPKQAEVSVAEVRS